MELVKYALSVGYRLIDTARSYGNEACIGQAIRTAGVAREEITIITKAQPDDYLVSGGGAAAVAASLQELDTGYVDVFLLHQPPDPASSDIAAEDMGHLLTAWRELDVLRTSGRIRALGVSNFQPVVLERFREAVARENLAPIEMVQAKWSIFHRGWFFNPDGINLVDYCKEYGIKLLGFRAILAESYSPPIATDPNVAAVAQELGHTTTAAMVALRWALQTEGVWGMLATSSDAAHLVENWRARVDMPMLTEAQMARLDGLASLLRSPLNRVDRRASCNIYDV